MPAREASWESQQSALSGETALGGLGTSQVREAVGLVNEGRDYGGYSPDSESDREKLSGVYISWKPHFST